MKSAQRACCIHSPSSFFPLKYQALPPHNASFGSPANSVRSLSACFRITPRHCVSMLQSYQLLLCNVIALRMVSDHKPFPRGSVSSIQVFNWKIMLLNLTADTTGHSSIWTLRCPQWRCCLLEEELNGGLTGL